MNSSKTSHLPPLPAANGTKWPMAAPSEGNFSSSSSEVSWPKISIVTPSFNQGPYLEKTIRSVLLQGYPNLEYIVIDGGSTDNSVEIIKKYEPWIDFWVSEKDRGQSHAINKGFEHATGDLFAWLNSDDFYAPGALKRVVEVYRANPTVGAIVGAGDMVDEKGGVLRYNPAFAVTVEALYHWADRYFWQPSCFFTREAWKSCGPLAEKHHFAMDLDLWFKIAEKFRFATTAELLSSSLMHDNAKTTAYTAQTRIDAAFVTLAHGGEQQARKSLLDFIESIQEQHKNALESDKKELEKIRNSVSWRITAPLRVLAGLILSYGQKK